MIRPDPISDKEQSDNVAGEQGSRMDAVHMRALQRRIAEAHLRQDSAAAHNVPEMLSLEAATQLLHELRVYQIELEMQNEALQESQIALDAALGQYFELYDLAPIAYCTVNLQGLIWQANLAASSLFGQTRNAMLNRPFSRHIYTEDQDIYYLGRRRLATGGEPQSFELRLIGPDEKPFWAALTIAVGLDPGGNPETRIVLSDISEQRKVEAEHARLREALLRKNADLESTHGAADYAARERPKHIFEISRELDTRLQTVLDRLLAAYSPGLSQEQRQSIDQIQIAGRYVSSALDADIEPTTGGAAIAYRLLRN